ncbi:TlpA disulfide reductase family protein [Aestuariibaculum suncheonense]|uniref:AhpC/TSA family protein n=1 Tax=Aestuariibaculum suncheonense TaxID=1028745 RepID=A0A8J6QG84_9FLAO|nr:TlpA disulfide reductase family protein [Aestuariibaculum suncheonense]MBD0836075.1 AhpC/TSA family protein [Aestuariibaculum suncheonense]
MRNILVLVVLTLILSCKKETSKGFELEGNLSGVANGTKISLQPFAKYETKPEFEATVENGKFSFKGEVPEPRMYHLVLGEGKAYYFIMIENSTIKLDGHVLEKTSENDANTYYSFDDIKVSGSQSNEYFYSQYKVREDLNELHAKMQEEYKDINTMFGQARGLKDQKKMDSIMNLDRFKEYSKAEKNFFSTVENRFNKIIEVNKETSWGPLMMLTLYSYFTPDQRSTFEQMSEEAKQSFYGKMVEEDLYPANRTGEKVPEFITLGSDGKQYALTDLIKDKKVILIDFWASWCAPCRKELPNVKANYKKYADQGFEVIGISIDRDAKAWQKALEEEQMPWPNFNDNDVASLYKVKAVPTTYLIDNEGKLIADNVRGEELGKMLDQIFSLK